MIEWNHWHNEPYLVGGLILLAWAYALCTGPLRARFGLGIPFPTGAAWCYYSGLVIFYLAVGSPLDQAGERFLFSAHMLQHEIILYPAALLVVLGLPDWLTRAWWQSFLGRTVGRFMVHPLVVGIVYCMAVSLWHVPGLYDWALRDRVVHIGEHITFFVVGLQFWHCVVSRSSIAPGLGAGGQILFVCAVMVGLTPLFAFLAFSEQVLYPTYEYAPRIVAGFTPAQDQLLAAAVMKVGRLFVTLAVMARGFMLWNAQSEQDAKASDPHALRESPNRR